jgi:hypothetical protein
MNKELERTNKFYDNKNFIKNIILFNTGNDEIIYGQSAINIQLPLKLRVYTEDYDIFCKNPKFEAKQVEKALDKHFGGNFFKVIEAFHKGTFRVVSLIDGKVYADYTKIPKYVDYIIINGKKYITLNYAKKDKLKILKDPQAKFRHSKDRDALNRINIVQSINHYPNLLINKFKYL